MRILGLDIGTTSIGFALVDWEELRERGRIIHAGVRIFPEGVTDQEKEPLNKQRRVARLARRVRRRRKLRRRLLNELLTQSGLLPRFGTVEWSGVMAADPYDLRLRGLGEALGPYDFGRALYHLAQRRGMRGRAVSESEESEDKEAQEAAEKLAVGLKERTVGEYLAAIQYPERRRGHHLTRSMIEDEFDRLWSEQARYHPDVLTPELKRRVHHLVFFQRRTFWRLATLRTCRLIASAPLEPKGSWAGQQHVMLEQINKLRIAGGNARPLDLEEKRALAAAAMRQSSMTWGGVRRVLRPIWKKRGDPDAQKFNMEVAGAEKGIKCNVLEVRLIGIFGDAWERHPDRERIRAEIHRRLFEADYIRIGDKRIEIRFANEANEERAKLVNDLMRDWHVTRVQAEALSRIELPVGWMPISSEAIAAMRPHLEAGVGVGELLGSPDWAEWRARFFPNCIQPTGEVLDRLPSHPKSMPDVRNPTVTRALNELRKVVNNLSGAYGRPDAIRVELAREVGKSGRIRNDILNANRKRESERKKAAEDLSRNGFEHPSRNDIEKWLLWKECNERCPYSGDQIGFDALFREGRFQVEHIWPRSKWLDRRWINKTLCRVDINILKGNRSPYEMWGHDPDAWDRLKRNLDACGLPESKKRRFLAKPDEMNEDEWAERQLRDTGWAAKAARDFLKKLWPDDGSQAPVETVNGRLTAELRYRWGLDGVLNPNAGGKNRADHRHHAVDAIAAALTTRAFVKRLSDYFAREKMGERPRLPLPWPTLFDDARQAVENIVVSHRVRKKLSGGLHKETYYGDTREDGKTGSGIYRKFVATKPLNAMSNGEIEAIRDLAIREIVQRHIAERGGNPKKAFPPYPRLKTTNGTEGPEIRKARYTIKQQIDLMVPLRNAFADPASNHHVAVYSLPDGRIESEVVSLFEAVKRKGRGESVVRRINGAGAALVCSLSPGISLSFQMELSGRIIELSPACGPQAQSFLPIIHRPTAGYGRGPQPRRSCATAHARSRLTLSAGCGRTAIKGAGHAKEGRRNLLTRALVCGTSPTGHRTRWRGQGNATM